MTKITRRETMRAEMKPDDVRAARLLMNILNPESFATLLGRPRNGGA